MLYRWLPTFECNNAWRVPKLPGNLYEIEGVRHGILRWWVPRPRANDYENWLRKIERLSRLGSAALEAEMVQEKEISRINDEMEDATDPVYALLVDRKVKVPTQESAAPEIARIAMLRGFEFEPRARDPKHQVINILEGRRELPGCWYDSIHILKPVGAAEVVEPEPVPEVRQPRWAIPPTETISSPYL